MKTAAADLTGVNVPRKQQSRLEIQSKLRTMS